MRSRIVGTASAMGALRSGKESCFVGRKINYSHLIGHKKNVKSIHWL
jgi:hypothetical protein